MYEAYDVSDPTKEPIVIKDSWVEDKRPREGDALRSVLEDTSAELVLKMSDGVVQLLELRLDSHEGLDSIWQPNDYHPSLTAALR